MSEETPLKTASSYRRFMGFLEDRILVVGSLLIITYLLALSVAVSLAVFFIVQFLYFTYFPLRKDALGQTPGMSSMKIRFIRTDGNRVQAKTSALRCFYLAIVPDAILTVAEFSGDIDILQGSLVVLALYYLSIFTGLKPRLGIWDRLAGTRVVNAE